MKRVKNSRQSPELPRWLIKCPVTSGISHMLLRLLLFPVPCWMKDLPQYPGGPELPVWKLAEGEFFLPQKSESTTTGNRRERDHVFLPFVVSGIFWTFSSWKLSVEADIEGDQISFRTTTAGGDTKEWEIFSAGEVLYNLSLAAYALMDCTQNGSKAGILATRAIHAIYQWWKAMLFPLIESQGFIATLSQSPN